MNKLFIGLMFALLISMLLVGSEKRDRELENIFDYCQEQYRANALGVEYIEAMQECMN